MAGSLTATIRAYGPGDRPGCLTVFDSNVPRYFTESERPGFGAFLDDLPGTYLVAADGHGTVVACGGLAHVADEGRVDLCWGMVRADLHGRGIGRELLRARLERAKAISDAATVCLNTSHLTAAFYRRWGFETAQVTPDGFGRGLHRHDMRLKLTP